MGKCTTVYLDSHGRKHPAYYNVLANSGHTAALKNYLKIMAPVLSANLQQGTFHDLVNYSKLIAKDKTASLHGGPSRSKKDVGVFSPSRAREFALYLKAKELMDIAGPDTYQILQGLGSLQRKVAEQHWIDKAKEYYSEGTARETQLDDMSKEIIKGWKEDVAEKSVYHELIEKYVNYAKRHAKKGENYDPDTYISMRGPFSFIQKKVLNEIHRFLESKVFINPEYEVFTEFPIDVEGWSNRGIIDLLVYDAKNNKAMIYDYKFYNNKSYNFYDTKARGHLKVGTPAAARWNNSESLNAIQMSEYTRMLQEYSITNVEPNVIPFALEIDEAASTSKKTKYSDVKMKPLKATSYLKPEIEEIMQNKGVPLTISHNERFDVTKVSGAKSFYEFLYTGSRIRPSSVIEKSTSVESVATEVNDEGKIFFYHELTGQLTQVQGNNKTERKEFLEAYVATRNKFSIKLVDEIISFVQGGMKEWSPSQKGDSKAKSLIEKLREFGKKTTLDKEGKEDFYAQLEASSRRSFGKSKAIEGSIRKLFSGLSNEEFTFERLSNDPRFGDRLHDGEALEGITQRVIKATNKRTGTVRLLTISPGSFGSMGFDHGNRKKYTTVLGGFMDDGRAAVNNIKLKDKQFNMELVALGSMMKEMKYDDSRLDFMPPKVALLRQGSIPSRSISLAELDSVLHVAADNIDKDTLSEEYKDILSTKISRTGIGTTTMAENYGVELLDLLYTSSTFGNREISPESNQLRDHMERIRISDPAGRTMLLEKLYELKRSMDRAFQYNDISGNRSANEEFVKITRFITALHDMDPLLNMGDAQLQDAMLKDVTTMGNINNPYFTGLNEIFTHARLNVTEGMNKRKAKHDTLIVKYMKSEGVTSESLNKKAKHRLFRQLFVDTNLDSPEAVKENLMILKDPTDPKNKLSPEAKALIKNMMAIKQEMVKLYTGDTPLGKAKYKDIIEDEAYNPLAMPVAKQSMESGAEEGTGQDKWYQRWKAAMFGRKQSQREESQTEFRTDIYNPFMEQVTTPSKRFIVAGYTEDGRPSEEGDLIELEYNFDLLFENMVLNTLTQKYYSEALEVKTAVDLQMILQEEGGEVRTQKLREMLTTFTNLILHAGRTDSFDENGNIVRRATGFVSKVVLLGSASYQMMETLVNTVNLGAEAWTQFVTQKLVKDARVRFSATEVAKAASFTITEGALSHQLARRYGMLNRDPDKMKTERFRKTQSTIMSSKALYWLNAMPVEKVQTIILIASMMHDGSLDAHSLNEHGELIYNESKDKRFHAQPGEKLTEKQIKDRKMFRTFYQEELSSEGGLKEDGTFNRALTFTDTATIQTITTERMGALSADQKTKIETFAMGAAFGTFRRWLVSKREVWWRQYNPASKLKHDYKFVEDATHADGGFYTYVGEPNEGILNSIWLFAQAHLNGANSTVPKELQHLRKKNSIRGMSDIMLSVMLYALFASLMDEEDKLVRNKDGRYVSKKIPMSRTQQSFYYILMNAAGDMTFFYPIYTSFIGENASTIPMFSIANRIGTSAIGAIVGASEKDGDKVMEKINNIFRVSGAYRGGQDFIIPGIKELIE